MTQATSHTNPLNPTPSQAAGSGSRILLRAGRRGVIRPARRTPHSTQGAMSDGGMHIMFIANPQYHRGWV